MIVVSLHDLPYLARAKPFVISYDSMEIYGSGDQLNLLDGGVDWLGVYIDRFGSFGIPKSYDTMETYAPGATVNGLNGGTSFLNEPALWLSAYVDR